MADELIGDRYRRGERVGSGAMGVVWRARDERLGRTVALKEVTPGSSSDEGALLTSNRRVMREARLSARLHHPNAIAVFDVVEHEDRPWLVMEYLPSRDLADVLAERTLSPQEVARIGAQVAAALGAAHTAGIVHRDVKPGNILLADDGRVKVTDFGISRAVDEATLTSTGMVAGTPAYLAPEVARGGRADFRSDVWSLGATLYAAVEDAPPFGREENALAQLHKVASGEIVPPRRAGPLTAVLLRILQADPGRRPGVDDVRAELARLVEAGAETVAPAEPLTPVVASPAPVRGWPSAPAPFLPAPSAPAPSAVSSGPPAAPPGRTGAPRSTGGPPTTSPLAVAPGPAPAPAPAAPAAPPDVPAAPPPPGRDRSRRRVLAGLLAVVVLAGIVLVALLLPGADGGSTATSPGTAATPGADPTGSDPSSTDASATPSDGATTGAPATGGTVAGTPTQAISSYYGLLPGQLAQGWDQLTPTYRSRTAGGFGGYTNFWQPIAQVTVRGVSAQGSDAVDATVTYSYRDGRTVDERTLFRLVLDDGQWKIDDSQVLSSRGR